MKPQSSREDLFKLYQNLDKEEWESYVLSLSEPPHALTDTLYHMSFKEVPEGVWSPRTPIEGEASSEAHPIYGEMLPNRISTSSTLEGCWAGIFCYLLKTPGLGKSLTAYIYEAKPQRGCRILTPQTLSSHYLVQDAHLTYEHCLLGDVKMTLVSKLTIKNTLSAPESKWIKSHPFNEKRYGNLHYPPYILLNNEPITPETNMSTLKLNFSNEALQNQLSLEAISNPLSILSEGMTTKFTVLLTQLNAVNNSFASLTGIVPQGKIIPRKVRAITDGHNYMQLMNYGVGVPPGFIGPLVPYMGLLIDALGQYKNIRQSITGPVATEMGVLLANPDQLRTSTLSPLSKIDFHDKYHVGFGKRVTSFYNPKSTQDEISYARLFNDNADFLRAAELTTSLEHIMKLVSDEIPGVLEDVGVIAGLTDKLAIRIMQDKQAYGINASIANEVANIITNTAAAVSFLGSLLVMSDEAVGIVDNLIKKIH